MSNKFNPENFQSAFLEIYKSIGNHNLSLLNLNVKALEKMTKLNGFQELTQAKKPTDFTEAQLKLLTEMGREVTEYSQDIFNLAQKTQTEVSQQINEITKAFAEKETSGGNSSKKAA